MPYQVDRLDPSRTAVIVVDMQNDFVAEGAKLRSLQAANMVPTLAKTLKTCREKGVRVIYTAHVHRKDGCDMGLFDDLYGPIADRSSLVDETKGAEIFDALAPAPGVPAPAPPPPVLVTTAGPTPPLPALVSAAVATGLVPVV